MKSSQVKETVKLAVKAGTPLYLWGAPGVGKSDTIRAAASELQLEIRDVRAVLLDPTDLRGLPAVDGLNKQVNWIPPAFLPRDGAGILFLDELNAAPPLVQAACYQLILDRKLGEYTLPAGWQIIAAGNRDTDRAVTHRMSSALANRFIHIEFDVDLNEWITWGLAAGIQTEILGFIRYRPELLHSFDPTKNEKAFCTPRSWHYVSKIMAAGLSNGIEYETISGIIGPGAASEFVGFLKIFRALPNIDLILIDPDRVAVPADPATLYALAGVLISKMSDNSIIRIMKYIDRMPEEFQVLTVTDAIKKDPALSSTRPMIEWFSKHSDILV